MTDAADLAHDVLIRVAEFIRKLPAEQLSDLASGEAKLDLVPKGARATTKAPKKAPDNTLPRPAQEIAATMRDIGDRAAARRYLEVDLKLTEVKLKRLASDLQITVRGRKQRILDDIVEWAVGRRLDSEAISRAGGGR